MYKSQQGVERVTEKKYKEVIFRWQDGWGEYKTEIRIVRDNEEDFE